MDIISGLSNELLIKILLFVPTKVAVSTSILSKRWEYLWMWLPKLEYGHRHLSFSEIERLVCFLDRNLPLHIAPGIESFRLDLYRSKIKPENIRLWVSIAVSHCLRELEIYCSSYRAKPNILPSNLYTCKLLVILKLEGQILLDVPRMVLLPSLKTLQLRRVIYFNEESLQRLLSNCPVLEDLLVDLPEHERMGKLSVVVPSLQSLSLYIPYFCGIDGIVIKTPSLRFFKFMDRNDKSHYCLVENMPNLIEADIDVEFPNIKSLIGSITSAKRLAICSEAMYDEGFDFNQLKHLKLCSCKENSSDLLVRLLRDSSNLQVVELLKNCDHENNGGYFWNQPNIVPECMLLSLQTLNWSGYAGTPGEQVEVPKFEMIKELALSSRASTTCQLVFD